MNRFSRRTAEQHETAKNALDQALKDDPPLSDLTISNPTTCGLPYDASAIARAFAIPSLVYTPAPLGLESAREIVANDYRAHGFPTFTKERVAITASTSEAYAILFKMLCDPGDEILVPTPSYPLLEWIASFEGVRLVTYPLHYAGRWHIDTQALKAAVTPRTRAIVVVSPNNPTGSYLGRDELDAMLDLDLDLDLPIISDEVFARYPLKPLPEDRVDSVLRNADRGLVFALSGLSKLAALPQMKLGWIALGGEPAQIDEAMARLETVLDAYLSVGAPVQHALGDLLLASETTSDAIRARTNANLKFLREVEKRCRPMSVLDVEGGWYATIRLPEIHTDEEWALTLLKKASVFMHPGYFFDMTRGAHLVVSLLTPEDQFAAGLERAERVFDP